ncbi:MAG: zinc ribbon domain-containing protein [Planctomycetes bacterium]|nr:zinc ribbon domain-containing protein [Planctomycetota bacterium]
MPTYEYECESCKHAFEKFQQITASSIRKCPACGRHKLRRLAGVGGGVIFKGSGFYQTDYRSDGYKKDAAADKTGAQSGAKADKTGAQPGTTADKSGAESSVSSSASEGTKSSPGKAKCQHKTDQ